eukprot:1683318-Prymnesium_polylepis.1
MSSTSCSRPEFSSTWRLQGILRNGKPYYTTTTVDDFGLQRLYWLYYDERCSSDPTQQPVWILREELNSEPPNISRTSDLDGDGICVGYDGGCHSSTLSNTYDAYKYGGQDQESCEEKAIFYPVVIGIQDQLPLGHHDWRARCNADVGS